MAGVTGMGSPSQLGIPANDELNITPPEGMKFEAPTGQYVEAPPTRPSLDDIFGQQTAPAASGARPSLDEIFGQAQKPQPAEEFTMEPIGMMEELSNVPARAKAALQVTDKEIQASLESSFGKDRVRKRGDAIEYKAKDDKWRVWDAGIEISDFTTDLIRPVVEEVPASLATIAAAVPAVASMIASAGASTPVSVLAVAAARSGGAMLGQATADFMQSLTGVPRDEDRSAVLEYGLTAVLAPASGLLADYATKKIAQSAAKSASKKLMPPNELYKQEISEISESIAKVKELGGMENLPGTDTPVMLYHLNPSNQTAKELTEKASHLQGYGQMEEHLVQNFENSSKAFLKTLGNMDQQSMKSGQEFKGYVQEAIKKEGQAIGAVRDGLVDAAGNGELPIPKLKGKVEEFAKSVGFKIDGETNLQALKSYLVDEEGYSKQAAEVIVNKTNRMLEKVTNKEGRMTAAELVGAYEEMNGVYKNVAKGGAETSPLFRQKIGEIRRFFADELADKVEVISDKGAKTSYLKDLQNYRELVTASDEFATLLDKDNLASHSLSKAIFSKGANGLDAAEASKVLLRDKPELLEDVKGHFLLSAVAKSQNKLGKTDWTKFGKAVNDPELAPIIKTMFGDKAVDGFKAYETVARAIENGNVGKANSVDRALFLKNLGLAAAAKSPVMAGRAGVDILNQNAGAQAFAEIISKEGIDNFLKTAPKDAKPMLKKILSGLQKAALRTSQVSEIPIRRIGKDKSKDDANEAGQ